jgi:hypothetical protein
MYLKPAPGRLVRDPRNMRRLPEEGREIRVPLDLYWRRRMRMGDVIKADPPAPEHRARGHHRAKEG